MSSQYKPFVSWGHNVTQSSEKADQLIELAKPIVEFESKQGQSAFFVVMAPKEGQHFTQSTRLEILLNHESENYLDDVHKKSDAYKKFDKEQSNLLEKPTMAMQFTPKAGFLHRDKLPDTPLSEQFLWIAKLDAHPGKLPDLMEAVSTHAANVERTEDGTLSFLALESKDKENSVTLFERYVSGEYFNDTHATSESMKEYRNKTQSLLAERVTAGFRIVAGFLDKREVLA